MIIGYVEHDPVEIFCGLLGEAQEIFSKLRFRDTGLWNASIVSYIKQGDDLGAINCFDQMLLEGVPPDAITFTSGLKMCSRIRNGERGKELHIQVIKKGLSQKDLVLSSALVDMYAKCGSLIDSQEVFNVIPQKNVGLWNNLIASYMKHEHYERALDFFKQMQLEGITHDTITYACSLKACSNISAIHKGNEIHCVIEKASFVDKNSVIGNVLVYMYAKNGFLTQAQ